MKKIFLLIGTRPNFIKVTRFKSLAPRYGIDVQIIHTGQHYDQNMANVFFDQFDLRPDHFLNVGGETPNTQVGQIILKLEALFEDIGMPDILIVPGDVNSTLAGAVAANKLGIPLGHLESGLRSFDRKMPEEHNRVVTDNLADFCFVTEPSGLENLHNERIAARVELVGNTMIDTLVHFEDRIDSSAVLAELGVDPDSYFLMTFHRPSNVDESSSMIKLLELLELVSEYGKMVLPLHPRTLKKLGEHGLDERLRAIDGLILTEPLGYFEFQKLIKHSRAVLTDSGGIQEETTYRQVPCLTFRENTERPITIEIGTNTLVKFEPQSVRKHIDQIASGSYKKGDVPEKWDGHTTERILEILSR